MDGVIGCCHCFTRRLATYLQTFIPLSSFCTFFVLLKIKFFFLFSVLLRVRWGEVIGDPGHVRGHCFKCQVRGPMHNFILPRS